MASITTAECQLEEQLIEKLRGLKYEYRPDIRDRAGCHWWLAHQCDGRTGVQ